MTTHAATLKEAVESARPIRGTRYAIGSFLPMVGLSARPRPIYVLTLDGVEVDRGSKADLMLCAKSAPGSPLGACHARYEATRAAAPVPLKEWVPALAKEIHGAKWSPNLDFVTHLQAQQLAPSLGIQWANEMPAADVTALREAVLALHEGNRS